MPGVGMVVFQPRRMLRAADVGSMNGRSDVWTGGAGWAGLVDVGVPRRLVGV
jgi:hypothetical protein